MNRRRLNHLIMACLVALLLTGVSAAAILTSTPRSADVSARYIPTEVGIPIRYDFGEWRYPPDETYFHTWSRGDELFMQTDLEIWNDPITADPKIYSWGGYFLTDSHYFEEFSASVDVRMIDADWNASGCLAVRTDSALGPDSDLNSVWLCLSGYGLWTTWYDHTGARSGGKWMFLDQSAYFATANPLYEWNRLKIIAKGEMTWMFLNDEYVGYAYHPGPPTGAIGVRIDIPRDGYGTFAFRNLTISRID